MTSLEIGKTRNVVCKKCRGRPAMVLYRIEKTRHFVLVCPNCGRRRSYREFLQLLTKGV